MSRTIFGASESKPMVSLGRDIKANYPGAAKVTMRSKGIPNASKRRNLGTET